MLRRGVKNHSGRVSDVKFSPDVFEAAMNLVVDHIKSPSHRISGDGKRTVVVESDHRRTKLFGFPQFDLRFALFNARNGRDCGE